EIIRLRRLQVGPAKLAAWVERLGLSQGLAVEDEDATGDRLTAPIDVEPQARGQLGLPSRPPAADTGDAGPRDVAPQIYRVRLADGQELGPLSYPRLVELFATGRIHEGTRIARESQDFREPGAFPELTRFVTSPALRWEP